jgi:hypothetical protein
MKKNLVKLALSGAALAAVAATLGTSTYAWYTTNPTVNANNIKAGTSDTGSSSIFISKDPGTTKTWSSTVTFGENDFSSVKLTPLSYATGGQFKAIVSSTGDLGSAQAGGTAVLSTTLYFKSSKVASDNAQKVYIKSIAIENTTTDQDADTAGLQLPAADNLLYDASSDESTGGVADNAATYTVDFRRSLAMAVVNEADTVDTSFTLDNAAYRKSQTITESVSTGAAQAYYNAVMDKDLTGGAVTAAAALTKSANPTPIATLPTDGVAYDTVVFYIYLDGASEWCYDACQGQNFKIDLQFTSDKTQAINYQA